MPWSLLLDVLYWHAHRVRWISPFGMQEPLLEPRLPAILSNIRQFNPHAGITVYSNMSIFPEAMWRQIIEYQLLDAVAVSFYGTDKRTYEKLQPPLDYYATQRNIKRLMRLKRSLGWAKPQVNMHVLVTRDTHAKANDFKRRWDGVVDSVGFVHYDSWAGKTKDWDDAYEESIWNRITPSAEERVPCHRLWTTMMIQSTGDLVPCCLDSHTEEPLGNLRDDPYTWWRSPRLNEIRELHLEGLWDLVPLCKNCSVWRRETPKEWIDGWEKLRPVLSAASPSAG